MKCDRVEFKFEPSVNLDDVLSTARLAFLGAGGLHGEAIVKLYADSRLNRARRTIAVFGAADIVASIAALLATFLAREIGESAFSTTFKPADTVGRGSRPVA